MEVQLGGTELDEGHAGCISFILSALLLLLVAGAKVMLVALTCITSGDFEYWRKRHCGLIPFENYKWHWKKPSRLGAGQNSVCFILFIYFF